MKIKELSLTVSRTFNLGNFESLRLEAGATLSVNEEAGESLDAARELLLVEARNSLRAAYQDQHPKFQKKEA